MINMTASEDKYAFNEAVLLKDCVKLSFKSVEILEEEEREERIEKLEKRIDELESKIDFLNYLLTKHGKEWNC